MYRRIDFLSSVPKTLALMLFAAVVAIFSPSARATATLRISVDDGLTWTNVVDNGPLDLNTNVGTILYNGPGTTFKGVFVASSQRGPDTISYVDLNCSVISGPTSLLFQYSDDGFGPFYGSFESSIGGNGSSSVACNTYLDPTSQLFGDTNLAGTNSLTGGFTWSAKSAIFSLPSFSLTAEAKVTAPGDGTSFDLLLIASSPIAPKIHATILGGAVNLSFDTESGFTYVLEGRSSLANGEWTPLQSIDGHNSTVTLVDSVAGAKFYRVSVH